jgi:hypothetical protein
MAIWSILWPFGIFFPYLVCCTKENLASLGYATKNPFKMKGCVIQSSQLPILPKKTAKCAMMLGALAQADDQKVRVRIPPGCKVFRAH